ncbi:hypothetical protein LUZ63_012836 [Rhynchospora breviuscula]|uniref:KIB1-4 beta-propeller domain-containing protein n=1 Tax=Rhynchospora breviuscula TaxID=2022672 RepID=A0A9Q0C7F4_9POAL|nr:hypothetical protein LUZ63_012836 [Rhynchospora breviuscula]
MNAGEEDGERDWASLLLEVLNLIAKCLREISDFVRFSAVCHAWRSSIPVADLPPQFPWILEKRTDPRDPNLKFYSPPLDKTYTIPASRSLDKDILSGPPSHDHMFTINYVPFGTRPMPPRVVSLLNPLTNHEIPLPACPYVHSNFWIGLLQNQTGEYVIVCYVHSDWQHCVLAFCHPNHQNNCHKLKLDPRIRFWRHFYFKGMLFSVDRCTGVTKVTNTADGALAYVVPSPVESYSEQTEEYGLVQDTIGNILRISKKYHCWTYDVYRLDVGSKNNSSPCWIEVSSIGNQAIFIDLKGCFVLRADHESSGIKENTIYLLRSEWTGIRSPPKYWAAWVDIQTGWPKRLPCPFEQPVSWLLPNLHRL